MNQEKEVLSALRSTTVRKALMRVPTRVAEVMTRNVVRLSPQQSFFEALSLLASHRFRHLLVIGEDQQLAGVISDRDLLRMMTRKGALESTRVADFMKTEVVTVQPETFLSMAVAEMLFRRINCLPVINEAGQVCGILTSTDLLRAFQRVQEQVEQAVNERSLSRE
jgi:CBS-domain-containing membrane protein